MLLEARSSGQNISGLPPFKGMRGKTWGVEGFQGNENPDASWIDIEALF